MLSIILTFWFWVKSSLQLPPSAVRFSPHKREREDAHTVLRSDGYIKVWPFNYNHKHSLRGSDCIIKIMFMRLCGNSFLNNPFQRLRKPDTHIQSAGTAVTIIRVTEQRFCSLFTGVSAKSTPSVPLGLLLSRHVPQW